MNDWLIFANIQLHLIYFYNKLIFVEFWNGKQLNTWNLPKARTSTALQPEHARYDKPLQLVHMARIPAGATHSVLQKASTGELREDLWKKWAEIRNRAELNL